MKLLFKIILLAIISISLVGCFGNDRPTDTDIKNAFLEPNEYLEIDDFERLNGVSLAENRYKVMFKAKIIFKKDPKDIPKHILQAIAIASTKINTDGSDADAGFLVTMILGAALMGYIEELKKKSVGDLAYEEEDEVIFIKSEEGWIPE